MKYFNNLAIDNANQFRNKINNSIVACDGLLGKDPYEIANKENNGSNQELSGNKKVFDDAELDAHLHKYIER